MKKITKALLIIPALAMLLAVYSCNANQDASRSPAGNSSPNTSNATNSPSSPSKPAEQNTPSAPVNSVAPSTSTPVEPPSPSIPEVDYTVEKGVLSMATNAEFPPYEYWEGSGIIGIDAEIAGAIAEKLGLTLRIDDMEFTSILAAVTSGKSDIAMAGLTVTEERMESVNFSASYATGVQVIIVKEDSPITSVDDLFDVGGYNIGVQESTTGDLYSTWDLEDEGLATVFRYPKGADAVMALSTNKVDCVIIDNEPAKAFVAANTGLKILDTEYAVEDYAIAFAKDNAELMDAVDGALRELIADGTVQKILDKYINTD